MSALMYRLSFQWINFNEISYRMLSFPLLYNWFMCSRQTVHRFQYHFVLLSNITMFTACFLSNATCFGPSYGPSQGVHIHNKNVSMYVSKFYELANFVLNWYIDCQATNKANSQERQDHIFPANKWFSFVTGSFYASSAAPHATFLTPHPSQYNCFHPPVASPLILLTVSSLPTVLAEVKGCVNGIGSCWSHKWSDKLKYRHFGRFTFFFF